MNFVLLRTITVFALLRTIILYSSYSFRIEFIFCCVLVSLSLFHWFSISVYLSLFLCFSSSSNLAQSNSSIQTYEVKLNPKINYPRDPGYSLSLFHYFVFFFCIWLCIFEKVRRTYPNTLTFSELFINFCLRCCLFCCLRNLYLLRSLYSNNFTSVGCLSIIVFSALLCFGLHQ